MTAPVGRRRLHPLSPLLHGAKMLAVVVVGISWQGYANLGLPRWAALVGVVCVATVAWSVITWYTTGYELHRRELRIHDGVLSRRSRAIPLERLQSVEVRQTALAQLCGLAELRLEVVGGSSTEAPLAYLTLGEARALRDQLLALAGGADAAADGAAAPAATPPPVLLNSVPREQLIIGQLLTPAAWAVPLGMGFIVLQSVLEASWSFIGLASTVTALVGVAAQPVRRLLADWGFRLSRGASGLTVDRGLLDRRHQVVPVDRVQRVRVVWPLLWRPVGWLRLHVDIAGVHRGGQQEPAAAADTLLPVGDLPTAERLLPAVLPGVALRALPMARPPQRARWLAPISWPWLAAALTPTAVVTRSGPLTRTLTLVPYARIQSVRVTQSWPQRRLGLATLHVDSAAGPATAPHRDATEAHQLAATLADQIIRR